MTDQEETAVNAELESLASFVHATRAELVGLNEKVPNAADALQGVTKATEKATHNILALVEELMDRDLASAGALDSLGAHVQADTPPGEAARVLREAHEHRSQVLCQLMTELSFQDLTSQAIYRITNTLEHIERRLRALLNGAPLEEAGPGRAESMSGLARLEERSRGESRQDMVDQLLGADLR